LAGLAAGNVLIITKNIKNHHRECLFGVISKKIR